MYRLLILILFPLCSGCLPQTFYSKCVDAGYEGAELEMCIKRTRNGDPVYLENLNEWRSYRH